MVALEGSKPLVHAASAMARDGRLVIACPSNSGASVTQEVTMDANANPDRITFKQCDPMCLPAGLAGEFSVCFMKAGFTEKVS